MEVIQITSLSMILLGSLDVYGLFNTPPSRALGVNYPLEVTQVAVPRGERYVSLTVRPTN